MATVVFYDGVCGLCDRLIRFLLARDRDRRLWFAPLQGALARTALLPRGHDPSDLDSIYVIADWRQPTERALARSAAVRHALSELGGPWRMLARAAAIVPASIADAVYGLIARRRYRLFGRLASCPVPPPEWRERFIDPEWREPFIDPEWREPFIDPEWREPFIDQ